MTILALTLHKIIEIEIIAINDFCYTKIVTLPIDDPLLGELHDFHDNIWHFIQCKLPNLAAACRHSMFAEILFTEIEL
jgi:hypothetical protein